MWEQVAEIGARSQLVVCVTGAFTGAVLAAQTLFQFKLFGLETAAGGLVSVAMLRELGPSITGLMLAGRVGSAMAAEIGTMKVTEQVIDKRGEEQFQDVLVTVLKPEQVLGLNGYLKFLRNGENLGGCTTTDAIRVGYYRDGQPLGFEGFTDSSCLMSGLSFALTEIEADENLRKLYRMGLNDEEASNLCTPAGILDEENERRMSLGAESLFVER